MVNPFQIQVAQPDLSPVLQGIGSIAKQARESMTQKKMQEEFADVVKTNDPNAMAKLVTKYPQFSEVLKTSFGFTNKASEKIVKDAYGRAITDPDNAGQYLGQAVTQLQSMGIDPQNTMADLQMYQQNPQAAIEKMRLGYAGIDPQGYKALTEKRFEQGSGKMEGYSFDPASGQYTINPEMRQQLLISAQEEAAKEGMLDSKAIAGVNDKVTSLTNDVNDIVQSANSLEALKERGSPAAQLAAVFKFMKANDPTSTVREGEQGMVYAAEGAMKGFANKINALMGEGGLSKEGFLDLVDTAKSLANSAVVSAEENVGGYLDVLSDKIPQKDLDKLRSRVPKRFDIAGPNDLPEGVTEEDIKATMQANSMTREEVLNRLRANQ